MDSLSYARLESGVCEEPNSEPDIELNISLLENAASVNASDEDFYASLLAQENIAKAKKLVSPVTWRLYEEMDLLRQQWKVMLTATIALLYFTCIVFLNLAFYRFEIGPRLHDLGHQVLPEVDEVSDWVDGPMYCLYPIVGSLAVGTLVHKEGSKKPYLVNIIKRFGCVFAIGHFLRAATYLATSVPGSANHCLDPVSVELNRPTVPEIFYKPASLIVNCGDLMFSGHMLQMILFCLLIHKYGKQSWVITRNQHMAIVIFTALLCVMQSCLILMARHHYTSDIVVAGYVTPLLWYFYNNEIDKKDREPDQEQVARSVLDWNSGLQD